MILNKQGWHYLTAKKLSELLRGITSKLSGDIYCLNCLHSFARKSKHESHWKVCENKDFCDVAMPSKDTKILQLNKYLTCCHILFMQILKF